MAACLSQPRWAPLVEFVAALLAPLLPETPSAVPTTAIVPSSAAHGAANGDSDADSDFEAEQSAAVRAHASSAAVPPCALPVPLRDALVAFAQSAAPAYAEARPHLRAPVEQVVTLARIALCARVSTRRRVAAGRAPARGRVRRAGGACGARARRSGGVARTSRRALSALLIYSNSLKREPLRRQWRRLEMGG